MPSDRRPRSSVADRALPYGALVALMSYTFARVGIAFTMTNDRTHWTKNEPRHCTATSRGNSPGKDADMSGDLRTHRVSGIAQRDYNPRMASAGYGAEQARQAQDFRRVIDAIPTLAWAACLDGSADFFNQRWLDYTGLSVEQARGWGWTIALHPDDLDGLVSCWRSVLASREPGEIEGRLRRFDGGYRWFLFRATPSFDDDGGVVKWFGTNTDIEDRKRAEALLAAEKRTLEMVASGTRVAHILDSLCDTIDVQAGNTISAVMLMDADGMRLWPAAGPRVPKSWTEAITPLKIGPRVGSCGTAAALKRRVIVSDIATDPLWVEHRDRALSHGLRAAWSQPLLSKNQQVLGTFGMYYTEPRIPSETDLRLIEGAANIAVIAIEGERSQKALQGAYQEIKQSEARLRKIIDTIPTLAWCSLPDGTGEFWNRRWHDYTGLTPEAVRGWGWQDAIHPEDLKEITDKWLGFLASGQPGEVEGRLRRFDGVYRWFLFRAEPLREESGNIVNWYGTDTDIDDRKRAEGDLERAFDEIAKSEAELRTIVDAIPQLIVAVGADGSILSANQAVLDYTGLTREEVESGKAHEMFHPDDSERLHDIREAAISRGVPFEYERRLRRKDGQYRWLLVQFNPVLDDRGNVIRWYATGTDIDDRKKAEERTRHENVALREQIDQVSMFEEIVGSSPALKTVLSSIVKVAVTDSTVLITGETGSGKELIARAIHRGSQRAGGAFITVNCSAIPPSLIASELFGHEKGAFTGALQRRPGRFELAHLGTIFLDEIGELPVETQVALLRVLQERQFERVGGSRVIRTDVRIIAATNRDLAAAIAAGTFRADLFYRLNVFPIHVPPLRNRREDIPMLVEYFVKRYAEKTRKQIRKIDKNTLKLCQSYHWPGNIRELQNIVERSVILGSGDTFWIDEAWLSSQDASRPVSLGTLPKTLQRYEKELIEAALAETKGKVAGPNGAAAKLGIPRSTLDLKIKQLNIKKPTIQ
jgi:PAS domain S-box-containing protein